MNEELLNCTKLAASMGRNPGYVTAMRSAGYQFPYPGRTTLSHALAWLAAHPDFRTTGYLMGLTPRARRSRKTNRAK